MHAGESPIWIASVSVSSFPLSEAPVSENCAPLSCQATGGVEYSLANSPGAVAVTVLVAPALLVAELVGAGFWAAIAVVVAVVVAMPGVLDDKLNGKVVGPASPGG